MKYVKCIEIHVNEHVERIFAINLPYRDRMPNYISECLKNI